VDHHHLAAKVRKADRSGIGFLETELRGMITACDDLVSRLPVHDKISRNKQGGQDDNDSEECNLFCTSALCHARRLLSPGIDKAKLYCNNAGHYTISRAGYQEKYVAHPLPGHIAKIKTELLQ
jgi:hypothetical protein